MTKTHSGLQMTQHLNDFLQDNEHKQYATAQGTHIHALLQQIVFDNETPSGDSKLYSVIQQHPELQRYFTKNTRTEVPIAGFLNNIFVSRRIDRLLIDTDNKTVEFLDYKTDMDTNIFRDKYTKQLTEYAWLLRSAYPKYKITGFILWTQNWQLEQIISI